MRNLLSQAKSETVSFPMYARNGRVLHRQLRKQESGQFTSELA